MPEKAIAPSQPTGIGKPKPPRRPAMSGVVSNADV
jgi:hypothetical protein